MSDTFAREDHIPNRFEDRILSISNVLYRQRIKRCVDLLLVFSLLPILLPVIGILYLVARLDGGKTGFYGHERVGKCGQPFTCWKIRSMSPHSENLLDALLARDAQARADWDRDQKLRNDPRVTRIGRYLRESSLDELPQIWNVLRGEMSIVGPRPVTEAELVRYGTGKRAYLSMRPGITGLWQVSGRNDVTYDERVQFDLTYRENISWFYDACILVRTLGVLLSRNGL